MSRDHPVIIALRDTTKLRPSQIEFIVENGHAYRGTPLPAGVKRWPVGSCIPGAQDFEDRGVGRFVSGFVLRPGTRTPIHHAWVTPDGNRALDPTLPDPRDNLYWGLAGRHHERLAAMIAKGFRGVTSGGVPADLVPGTWARSIMPPFKMF